MKAMKTASDVATVQRLRSDVALYISRSVYGEGRSLTQAAKRLRIPRSTLIKIMNGCTSSLSLDYLLRISVRAGLDLVLQTGVVPEEAGAFLSTCDANSRKGIRPKTADPLADAWLELTRAMTPEQRLLTQIVMSAPRAF